QHLGCLALGDPLDVQLAITFKQVSALKARPALVAIMIATVLFLAYRCHRLPPLPQSLPCEKWRAKDGETAPRLQSLSVSSQVFSWSSSRRDGRRGERGPFFVNETFSSYRSGIIPSPPCDTGFGRKRKVIHRTVVRSQTALLA